MSDNPYAPPPSGAGPIVTKSPGASLLLPAIILIVLSSIWILLTCVATPPIILRTYHEFSAAQDPEMSARKGGELAGAATFAAAMVLVQVLVINGAISMIRLRGYNRAMTAAIISVIPLCSACYVLGIPFGIWALILLLRPDVKSAFQ